jgi:hypothetical protein
MIHTNYRFTYPFIYGSTALCLTLAAFSVSLILYIVGRTPLTGDQPVARLLPAHRTAQTHNKRTWTPMPQVGFKSTIPVSEWTKTVHALRRVHITRARAHQACNSTHRISAGSASTCTVTSLASTSTSNVDAPFRPCGHCELLRLATQRHLSYDIRTIHVASSSRI